MIAFILSFSVNSCKKEAKNPTPLPVKIADTRVLPEEINTWFDKMPQVKPSATLLAAAQQALINGVQVVRIPVGYNAALYFTKENDSLKVYAYKWIYQNLDAEKYTGNIDIYNFQNQNLTRETYADGNLINTLPLAHYSQKISNASSNSNLKTSECIFNIFALIWDWITGQTGDGNSGGGGGGGGGGFDAYMYSYGASPSDYSSYSSTTGGGSGGSGGGTGGGGGSTWGSPPCPTTTTSTVPDAGNKLKINQAPSTDPNDPGYGGGGGYGCTVDNSQQWWAYQMSNDPLKYYKSPDDNLPVYIADNSHLHGQPLDGYDASATYYSWYDSNSIMYSLNNESNGDPIELFLIANYKGSALLDLSQYSTSSNNYHVGAYYLTPNFNSSGMLLFYSAWRNSTNGIEYLIQPSGLSAFIKNYKFYLAAANLVYLNGRPSQAMVKMMAADYASGLKDMWGQAITDPVYLTNLAVAFVVGAAPAEQVTFINYENVTSTSKSIANFSIGMTLDDFETSLSRNTGKVWVANQNSPSIKTLTNGKFEYTSRTGPNSNSGPTVDVRYNGELKIKYRLQ